MNEEKRAQIIKDHPNLYRHKVQFGFDCGDGWLTIIEDLSSKLEGLIVKWKKENPDCPEDDQFMYATQVKEKYAALCFYMESPTDEMEACLELAEVRSQQTCEICGNPGRLRKTGWMYTRCDECWEERAKKWSWAGHADKHEDKFPKYPEMPNAH